MEDGGNSWWKLIVSGLELAYVMDFTMYWAALMVDHVRRNYSSCCLFVLLLKVC